VVSISVLKRVIITGGTGGLGNSITKQFKAAGWEVLALSRNDLDLTCSLAIDTFFSANVCDLLICAAGVIRDQPLAKMEESTWDEIYEINYLAAKKCALAAISTMMKNNSGHVIFISSYAANHPTAGQAAYATAKASILGLTRDLALRYGSNNIRANAILPGFMATPMTVNVSDKRKQVVHELHTMGELNTPEIVAEFILFLEEHMPYTSSQIFQLDSRPSF
jgi:3-oxoacyl-[acyl-carrier protein] reductase